jgi:uncharacterized protein YndB with AHSA1/START domain
MIVADLQPRTQDIVIDEVFPHAAEAIWKTLTNAELIGRWLMAPTGFEPIEGKDFTYQTTPGGAWDGVIHCRVIKVTPNRSLSYKWKGGHEANTGYGAPLDTIVTWTLTPVDGGTRVQLVHAGFVTPRNDHAYKTMGEGWAKVVRRLDALAGKTIEPEA